MLSWLMPMTRKANVFDDDRYWSGPASTQRTRAGVAVNEEVALTYSTVFLCTRILAEPTASMPLCLYREAKDGDREKVDLPASRVIENPNEEMSAGPFREGRTMHQVNWGQGFSEIVRSARGEPLELWPIHPSRVTPSKEPGFPYAVRNADNTVSLLRREEMLHIPGTLSEDGIWGRSIIRQAAEDIGFGLGIERHAGAYFGSGGQPKGVVIAPGLKKAEHRQQFRRDWKEIHSSPESSEVAILDNKDSSYIPITMSNNDRQFLESRAFSSKQIGNWYRVAQYWLGDSLPGSALEHVSALFIAYTLYPWLHRWEEQLGLKLLTREQRVTHYFEHDLSSLLRGDIAARMNAYRIGITTGVYTINACRRMENLNGIGPDGDVAYVPANMMTAEAMARGESSMARGPGSDHTGAPADSPLDHNDNPMDQTGLRASEERGVMRGNLVRQLTSLQAALPERPAHDWTAAARGCLTDALGRILTKEANAALRASKGDFDSWLRGWYHEHEQQVREIVAPTCAVLKLAGVGELSQPANLAAWLRARSTDELQVAYNSDSRDAFAARLAAWPTERAKRLTETIIAGEP